MKLETLDLSGCLYDPRKSSLLNDISIHKEFAHPLSYNIPRKAMVTYIVLIYDVASPLRREIRDLGARKLMALELAGFSPEKNARFKRHIELLLEGKNQEVTAMIVKYLTLLNDPTWTRLCIYEQMLYMETARAMNGAYKDAKKMSDSIDKLADTKSKLMEEIIGGKQEAEPILAAIYKQTTKGLDVSPEKISAYIMAMREEGGVVDIPEEWNPYENWKDGERGEEYKIDSLKYVGAK